MQLKTILNNHFGVILAHIQATDRSTRYYVQLPLNHEFFDKLQHQHGGANEHHHHYEVVIDGSPVPNAGSQLPLQNPQLDRQGSRAMAALKTLSGQISHLGARNSTFDVGMPVSIMAKTMHDNIHKILSTNSNINANISTNKQLSVAHTVDDHASDDEQKNEDKHEDKHEHEKDKHEKDTKKDENGDKGIFSKVVLSGDHVDDIETTKLLCKTIIDTFELLYNKYISENADFSINIKSRSRRRLRRMFDSNYVKLPKTSTNKIVAPIMTSAVSVSVEMSGNNSSSTKLLFQTHTVREVAEYLMQNSNHDDDHDMTPDKILELILARLISRVEMAVDEISSLLNDSHSRFMKDVELFEKTVKIAKKFHHHQHHHTHHHLKRDSSVNPP